MITYEHLIWKPIFPSDFFSHYSSLQSNVHKSEYQRRHKKRVMLKCNVCVGLNEQWHNVRLNKGAIQQNYSTVRVTWVRVKCNRTTRILNMRSFLFEPSLEPSRTNATEASTKRILIMNIPAYSCMYLWMCVFVWVFLLFHRNINELKRFKLIDNSFTTFLSHSTPVYLTDIDCTVWWYN